MYAPRSSKLCWMSGFSEILVPFWGRLQPLASVRFFILYHTFIYIKMIVQTFLLYNVNMNNYIYIYLYICCWLDFETLQFLAQTVYTITSYPKQTHLLVRHSWATTSPNFLEPAKQIQSKLTKRRSIMLQFYCLKAHLIWHINEARGQSSRSCDTTKVNILELEANAPHHILKSFSENVACVLVVTDTFAELWSCAPNTWAKVVSPLKVAEEHSETLQQRSTKYLRHLWICMTLSKGCHMMLQGLT